MNVVNPRKALPRVAPRALFVAVTMSLCGAAVAQQQPAVPTPAPPGTQAPIPLPPGTPGPTPAKGAAPMMPPADGAASVMPLPKGAGVTPPGLIAQPQDAKMPSALRVISKSDALPAKVTELVIRDDEPGNGTPVLPGQAVNVQYTGWLYDPSKPEGKGAKFDSSRDRQLPFGFIIGAGRVIKGWDHGVAGMKPKGKRTLIVPPQMAYGERAKGDKIPANSTLLFEVELFDVLTQPAAASAAPPGSASVPTQTPVSPKK
jgi:FKBP-type peptidyl-prolyl cis-trans isomerase FkpA